MMKTPNGIMKTLPLIIGAVLALGEFMSAAAPGAEKGSAKGGASDLIQMHQIKTQAEAEALKPGDSMAMVCVKCKSVVVHRVTVEKGHIKTVTPGEKHLCPGCNSTIEVVGHGKAKTDVVKHICQACGEDSVFCCATKAGSGPTKGMEKK